MHVSAPGKMLISGEWAVLEMENPAIVAAVDKRVHVTVEKADCITLTVDDFGIKNIRAYFDRGLHLDCSEKEKEKLIFMKAAIEATLNYLGKYKPFKIRSWGEESQIGSKKIGFGSSAAAVVAAVAAVLAFHGKDIKKSKDIIYKLSSIAHYYAQGKVGSAFDIAASTYGGVFVYTRFDYNWLNEGMKKGNIRETVRQKWPGFSVEELKIPENFTLLVAWTKESAYTSAMVKQMSSFKEQNPEEYKRLYGSITALVRELVIAWKKEDSKKIYELLNKNEEFLRELGQMSGVNIETKELKALSELAGRAGAAGKLSGAGGGDCGIAVCFDNATAEKIRQLWKKAGLHVLDVAIDRNGIRIE